MILTGLVLFLLCPTVFAGSFRSLSIKEGLASRQVFQINKDSAGYIWAYTRAGMDRYDGNEIKHYRLGETVDFKNYILSATIMTLDRTGNVWVALKNGMVYSYDRQTDAFRLRVDLTQLQSLPILYNILFDKDNRLWLCLSNGVYSWEEGVGLIPAALQGKLVNCMVQVNEGLFFAGTGKGVWQLTKVVGKQSFHVKKVALPGEMNVECLYSWENKLFIGTFADGAFVLDRTAGEVRSLGDFVPHVPIRTFEKTPDNSLLIAADGAGMLRIDAATGQLLKHYMTDEDDDRGLNGNTVSDICVDGQGGVWISTTTNGISYLDPAMPDVRRIRHEKNNANSLKSDHVNVLLQDSEGDLWYGTNEGVSLYRPASRKWTHFLGGTGSGGSVVLALAEDSGGNMWVGGYGIGVYCISKKTGWVRKLEKRNAHRDKGVATDYIYAIHAEGDCLWLGGIEGEFTRYNMRADSYTYYPIHCVGDIKPGKDGTLLLAGCDGLAVFDKATGKARWQRQFGNFTLHYPIRCLTQSSAGDIWMATDGEGLICFNPDKQTSRVYTTADGLASNSVNSLLEDNGGSIWFNTEKELYCLDLSRGIIVNANDFLDVSWGYYNPNAAFRLSDGHLAWGTAEGVVVFSPSLDLESHGSAELIFTDFKLLYESVKAGMKGSLLTTNINDTRRIILKYDQNSFSISFSAIDFTSPHRIRYEYMLDGYNKEWERSNSVRSVNYMNLSPGKYLFRLRAFDKYTGRQIGERVLEVVISRPYWFSWWAILLYLAVASVFAYMLVQNWRHKLNEDRIKDKIRSFVSIAHDIRTPVTLIKAPLNELEAQEGLPEESRRTLGVAVRNVEKLMAMIAQLIDLQRKERQAEKCLEVSCYHIEDYLKEKIAEFRLIALQKGVKLQLEVEPGMDEVWMDREKMDHIIDNLLSNALKYTENGAISVRTKTAKKQWSIEVSDTGIGIPKEEQGNIFHEFYRARNAANVEESGSGVGLMITRRIVKQHSGSISFSSVEGEGSTFTVSFPQRIKSSVAVESKDDIEETSAAETSVMEKDIRKKNKPAGKNVLLLVEDDEDMREYLTGSLSAEYEVVGVPDGGKALALAKDINPDIIISDIVMPVLEGDELCRILKSSVDTSHIPVILLTALSERENIIFGLEAGANDYIIKPFDLAVLKARIKNILQNRQHLRELVLSMGKVVDEAEYTSQLDKAFLEKVMAIITEEMSNSELTIDDFCMALGMSRTAVFNKMKTLTGQGPNDFIRIVRLNKSREFLGTRKYTIGEVSTMVGFSDPKYFSTCFKRQFGISPSKVLN
ncbi:ATP-binding protein [Bacteroides helcogenes]|nr:ATP-binding protein [Bacteroides helcogenes]MDY5238741.1 ATP-binding protein [Bacteroides helcogenes]